MHESKTRLREKQREALWKWRWLGLRDSTPGFKGAMVLLAAATIYIIVRAVTAG